MPALDPALRKKLERAVIRARDVAEAGAAATLVTLAVREREAYPTLTPAQREQRTALRARAKNLGEGSREDGYAPLTEAIAYEAWHRLLFARFLADNGLLMHPEYAAPLSIAECGELAAGEGADNGWDLAGRYAAAMLPGIFRPEDPAASVRLPRERRAALETLVAELPGEVFTSDDGLGWTYQVWQAKKKGEVNASGVKIGARELAPVTQLFTEDYMVRFLLENSLGAWWAARHPDSPLLAEMAYLRFTDDGAPAAGAFPGWPETAAEVTVMDPCCGSGHFLVRGFHLLREMRMEEEGLGAAAAGDAVLRDNLFGLELDERCVQIAAFAVALEAWKSGGYRALPAPQIACSGVPVAGQLEDWLALAGDDANLRETLERLHDLFTDAPIIGSLIDPPSVVTCQGVSAPKWEEVERALVRLTPGGEAAAIFAIAAGEAARAATLLGRRYTLVATNVPYLGIQRMPEATAAFLLHHYPNSANDIATIFIERCLRLTTGTMAIVTPMGWMFLRYYNAMRRELLASTSWRFIAPLGARAFEVISGEVVQSALLVLSRLEADRTVAAVDATGANNAESKATTLKTEPILLLSQDDLLRSPDTLLALDVTSDRSLSEFASSWQGLVTSDVARYIVRYWELDRIADPWSRYLTAPSRSLMDAGRECLLRWDRAQGDLVRNSGAHNFNPPAVLSKKGVLVAQSSLRVALYWGEMFNDASSPVIPTNQDNLAALWCYMSSPDYPARVRQINHKVIVGSGYLVKVPFDLDHWQRVAAEQYPDGLPAPHSDDPTQWLFTGHPVGSDHPLQVAVARLLGYRWPEQPQHDGLDHLADRDGIVPIPSVRGESPAGERLRALLAAAYGAEWSPATQERLLAGVGFAGRDLGAWLADSKGFFAQHARLFHNRPFIWQIWDGARDGFAVLVNSHTLDRATLEKLIYTYLGDWIARQELARQSGDASAEGRLVKARELKAKLEAILLGEAPYDIYVRWKPLHEQPIGWEPDLNDGVRLNIRPFVEAGVLRAKFSVNWNKDRGDNPPGSAARAYAAEAQAAAVNARDFPPTEGRERFNAVHLSRAVKDAARGGTRCGA
ncbi:MAG: hypothetical protein QM692_20795 [Thermomicrobiales bacterium]